MTSTAIATKTHELAVRENRRHFIGGSDIAALLGIAPLSWRRNSPVALFYDKTQPPREDKQGTAVKRRGKRWEAVVAEMLTEQLERTGHRVKIVGTNRQCKDPDVPYFAAEIDYEIQLDDDPEIVNVELKTVHPFKANEWGESNTDDAPLWYIAQTMWGLGITRRRRAILAPLFGADDLQVHPIYADDDTIAGMREKARIFWTEHVLTGRAPGPLFLSDMGLLFPSEAKVEPLEASGNDELIAKLLRLRAVDRDIKARQAEWDAIEFDLKRVMGACPEIDLNGKTAVTWKDKPYSYLDQSALKADEPKIHAAYMRRESSRVFQIKPFAWD